MDSHLWTVIILFAVYIVLAIAEAAIQVLAKHKAQLLLESLREKSSSNRIMLPESVSSLRSLLSLGKQLALISFAIFIATLSQRPLQEWLPYAIAGGILAFYLPMLVATRNPKGTLKILLPITRYFNIFLLLAAFPRDYFFNRYRAKARKQATSEENVEDAQQLEAYIDEAEEEGLFEPDEAEMVRQVVDFSDTVVKEVMTPRINMQCIDKTTSISEFAAIAADLKFSRYPVIEGKIDEVIGIIHIKSILDFSEEEKTRSTIEEIVNPPLYVPESKKVSSLLRDFQANKQQMAIVVDEYGGTAGIITLEDILEEIVGEIEDEHEVEEDQEIIENPDGSLSVSGNVDVTEIEKILDVELDDKSYETVSGLALSHLKHIPKPGEEFVTAGGIKVEIIDANERSIDKVKISKTGNDE